MLNAGGSGSGGRVGRRLTRGSAISFPPHTGCWVVFGQDTEPNIVEVLCDKVLHIDALYECVCEWWICSVKSKEKWHTTYWVTALGM